MDTATRKTSLKVGVLPSELKIIKSVASEKNIPISWVCRQAIIEYLENYK